MPESLTKRQQQVYDFIENYVLNKGYGPTVRELSLIHI